MKYLIDSDVTIDFLVGRPYAVETLNTVVAEGIGINLIAYAEVLEGVLGSKHRDRMEVAWRSFMKGVTIVDLDLTTMRLFAEWRNILRHRGRLIKDFDIVIAATAMQHDLILMSRNLSHFDRFEGLMIHSFD